MKLCFHLKRYLTMWTIIIFLSTAVTLEGTRPKQQYFRVKPQDREAVEGDTVEFQCHVENVAGDVQWSKDGFLLGFERDIPGYPRYFMIVNTVQGVYNLRIENVRLEDEAEYQCQVGPNEDQKPIRAVARLTVVIPPKNITINGLPDGEEVMVRENQRLILTCKTTGSKPAVEMKWYRRAVELVPEAAKLSVMLEEGRVYTTTSSLTLYPKLEHSGITYTCEAYHPTLEKPLRATIAVGVLFPPSPPSIQGYQKDGIVQVGDTVVLVCLSRGGRPAPRIVWYRDDVLVDVTYSTTGYETTNTLTFIAGTDDNDAVFRCEITNALTKEPMKESVKMKVLFAPKNLTITGPSEARRGDTIVLNCQSDYSNPPAQVSWMVDNSMVRSAETETYSTPDGWVTSSNLSLTITRQDPNTKIISCYAAAIPLRAPVARIHTVIVKYPPEPPNILGYEELSALKQGDLQRLTCVALGGNPPATLQWYKGDREIRAPVSVAGSGVSSELVILIDPSDNGATYRCRATNSAVNQPLEASVTLRVLFPPEKILMFVDPQLPKEDQAVTITCQTGSGNPIPKIIWHRNDNMVKEYFEEIVNASNGGVSVKSQLVFIAVPSDDGVRFSCQSSTESFPERIVANTILRVLYRPKFSSLVQKIDLMEGQTTEISLTARGNPDAVSYRWYSEGEAVPTKASEDAATVGHRFWHRITSLGPVLYVRSVSRHDTGVYTCEATNDHGSSNATVVLNVLFPAIVTNISTPFEVREGDNINLECSFEGNPLPENAISWRKDGSSLVQHTIEGKRSYLLLFNVTRGQSGEYECVADNGVGKESAQTTTISVIHRPMIRRSHLRSKVASDLKDTAKFRCIADSYSNASIKWSYKDTPVERNQKYEVKENHRNSTWESTLLVKQLEETDFGTYDCIAVNALGKDVFQFLLVKRGAPEPPLEVDVVNYTNNYIFISWKAGFDGGYVPSYRIRYRQQGAAKYYFQDAAPSRLYHKITELKPGTEYLIALSAWNDLGHSNFTAEIKVITTDVAVMDSTVAAPGKKVKKTTATSKWWWICSAVVGILLVMVNVIAVICLVQRGKCCTRSIGGVRCPPNHQCSEDRDKQLRYSIGNKTFFIAGEKVDVHSEHILMEKFKTDSRKTFLTVGMGEEKTAQESMDWKQENETKFMEKSEESLSKASSNEFPDILKQSNNEKSAFTEDRSTEVTDPLPSLGPQHCTYCLSSSPGSVHLGFSTGESSEENLLPTPTSTSSCDLRIRHILFEAEEPTLRPLAESADS